MRIVLPIYGFAAAGGYRVLSQLADQWIASGHDVAMLAHYSSRAPYFPTRAEIVWLDDNGRRLAEGDERRPYTRRGAGAVGGVLRALRRGLDHYAADADVILANQSFTVWPVQLSSSRARKYYYIQAYEPEFFVSDGGRFRSVLRLISYSSYFAPLERIVNAPLYMRYKAIRASHVVPPGLDLALMHPGETRPPWEGRRIVLGCIGRKERWKGTGVILEAFDEMLARGLPVELHVAFGNLPDDIAPSEHRKVVVPANDRELGEYYRSLDCMIATGTLQLGAAHYPVMEAMASRVPVVTTGYFPATEHNAWLVPPNDPLAIVHAVERMLGAPGDREARAATALEAIQAFAWPAVGQQMLEIFGRGR